MTEAVGVDLGGTKMRVGVIDEGMHVHYSATRSSLGLSQDELIAALEAAIDAAREERPDACAVGLGVPCTIDRRGGVVVSAVNLDLAGVELGELIEERLGMPVLLDNDANAAILAEHRFGAARGAGNAVMATIGTGIGGGLVLGGEVFRGSHGAGAELGHMVIDYEGPSCQGHCPNRGCIEAVASGTALAREGKAAAKRKPDSALGRALAAGTDFDGVLVTGAALDGDPGAQDVVEEIGRRLGIACSSWANIFDPDVIVMGGGVMAAGELLLEPARDELARRALPPMNETPVVAAELGPDAGMIGAAAMALSELDQGAS